MAELTGDDCDVDAFDAELSGVTSSLALSNPISSEMAVMRSSLLPGMLRALAGNVARQQERGRLFEIGKSFHGVVGDHTEVIRIAGVATGTALPEQWGAESRAVDFFDRRESLECDGFRPETLRLKSCSFSRSA